MIHNSVHFPKNFPTAEKSLSALVSRLLRLHKTTQDNPRQLRATYILFILQKGSFNCQVKVQIAGRHDP